MRELLNLAGFRIRSPKRADCAHCKGNSTGTVSFTSEVAYCHRCGWRSNRTRLEHELNPPMGGRKAQPHKKVLHAGSNPAVTKRREAQAMAAAFETWLNFWLRAIALREKQLYWAKRRAREYLGLHMDDPAAWDALIAFTEEEESLDVLWDFLTCERNSRWWNPPITREEVFRCWRDVQAVCVSLAPAKLRRSA